jgi:hypothetical protein
MASSKKRKQRTYLLSALTFALLTTTWLHTKRAHTAGSQQPTAVAPSGLATPLLPLGDQPVPILTPSPSPGSYATSGPMGPPPAQQSFAFNKHLRYTWSKDGQSWSPSSMLMTDIDTPQLGWVRNHLYVYYACAAKPPFTQPLGRSEVLRKGDDTFELGPTEPVVIAGEQAEGQTDPSVMQLPDKRYRIYYVVPALQNQHLRDPARDDTEIRSAVSRDGERWVKEPGIRLQGKGLVDPEVIVLKDGRFRLFFTLGADFKTRSAISKDGLTFTPEPGIRVEGGVTATMPLPDGTYSMIFQSLPWGAFPHPLLRSSSKNGFDFKAPVMLTLGERTPRDSKLEGPSTALMKNDKSWLLVYMLAKDTNPPAPTH